MNYNLYREGRPVEATTLELLRQRRSSGELDGTELVWRDGMADWEPLDAVIVRDAGVVPGRVAPPPIPKSAASSRRGWVIAAIVVVCLIGIGQMAWMSRNFFKAWSRGQSGAEDAVAVAQQPISAPASAITVTDVQREGRDFRRRQYIDGYEQRGERNPEIDAKVVRFLNEWLAHQYGERENNHEALRLWRELCADSRCNDPLVLTIMAVNSADLGDYRRFLERAVKGFEQSAHRGYPKFYAAQALARSLGGNSQRTSALESAALQYFQQGFADGSFTPDDQPLLADMLIDGNASTLFSRHSSSICDIVRGAGSQFKWLALVLAGESEIAAAWRARGGGYSGTVTPEGWKGFATHLASAREALTEAWKLRPKWAKAPARMVYVALGDSGIEEMREWFDRTLAAQVDHPGAWSNMRWGLRPRWHGSLDAIRDLGIEAVKSGRFDSDAPRQFFNCVTDIESELEAGPSERLFSRDDIWPWLEKMYNGYIDHQRGGKHAGSWRSTFAVAATLAGKHDIARQQLEAVAWKPKAESLSDWGLDLTLMPEEIAARTSLPADDVASAEMLFRMAQDSALEAFEALAARQISDERARRFVNTRIEMMKQERAMAAGDWVHMGPQSASDPLWVVLNGNVRTARNGVLEVESGPHGHLLYGRSRVGPNFAVRGDFEVLRSATGDFQAGFVMGVPDAHSERSWYSCRVRRRGSEAAVYFSPAFTQRQFRRVVVLKEGVNTLELRFQNGRATVVCNGNEVIRRGRSSLTLNVAPTDFTVGFGAFTDTGEEVIRYSNVQVRRLTGAPAESGQDAAASEQGE